MEDKLEFIITNKARCKKCGDTIESHHVHDYVSCECGAIAVDGGRDYLKRTGNFEDCEDLSEVLYLTKEEAIEQGYLKVYKKSDRKETSDEELLRMFKRYFDTSDYKESKFFKNM